MLSIIIFVYFYSPLLFLPIYTLIFYHFYLFFLAIFSEVWVLVHQVVIIGDSPVARCVAAKTKWIKSAVPGHIGLKSYYVLGHLVVVTTKENL